MIARTTKLAILAGILAFGLNACKKQEGCTDPKALNYNPDAEKYDGSCEYDELKIPETYNFANVKYSGQTARLQLLDKLASEIGKAGDGSVVTEQALIDIFENNNGDFDASKNLSGKCFDTAPFYSWFKEMEVMTSSSDSGEIDADGRFYNNDGVEIKQMVEKGLMGAVLYWQATSNYLHEIDLDDNSTVEDGKGTKMEHHFDEAFGYFGIPKDFGTNDETGGDFTTTSWFWGKYCIKRDGVLNNRETIWNAFLKGRAAISAKDYEARDEAIATIKENWELIIAGNIVHYLNDVKSEIANGEDHRHHWAEGKAFVMCLKYNTDKKISDADITKLDGFVGANPNDSNADYDSALQLVKDVYGFTDSQMLNL